MAAASSDLFQANIFRRLREGVGGVSKEEFFNRVLSNELHRTAAKFGCEIEISDHRLAQAQANWVSDLSGIERGGRLQGQRDEDAPPTADGIKHAAFLCYWLRRRQVVESIRDVEQYRDGDLQNAIVAVFGCEFLAIDLCFRLCLFGELVTRARSEQEAIEAIKNHELDKNLQREIAVLLYHKNVSPHSLYLVFKALLNGPGRALLAPNVVDLASRR